MAVGVGILGSGNIGTDLMYKVLRNPRLELRMLAGIDPESEGLARARGLDVPTSTAGVDAVLKDPDIAIVFDATSATAHLKHAPLLEAKGKIAIDLTPASVGPPLVPVLREGDSGSPGDPASPGEGGLPTNVSLATCGAQATVPIVHAVARVAPVEYAEIVSTIASLSAGPGTRQNIDEFTVATSRALERLGGAKRGKAIIILNPADPPIMMSNTIYTLVRDVEEEALHRSVEDVVERVQRYVPGYRLKVPPLVAPAPTGNGRLVTMMLEVTGAGDFLPEYAGNLDIMTAAAVGTAEAFAADLAA